MVKFNVGELNRNSKKVDVKVRVNSLLSERTVFNKKKQIEQKVAEFEVGDPTGTVIFTVWDDDIPKMKELIGSSIEITNGYMTIFSGQLKISTGLYGSWKPIDEKIDSVQGARVKVKPPAMPKDGIFKVNDLATDSRNVNITLKVIRKDDARQVNVKGTPHLVASVLAGDETGCILVSLWDDDIAKINVGDYIELKNGYISVFRGVMQLNKGRYGGEITKTEADFSVNEDNNLSTREL
ncbi:MAG: hypothetical protein ACTSRB_12190 [Candidatus Helarchaeota archaeon]